MGLITKNLTRKQIKKFNENGNVLTYNCFNIYLQETFSLFIDDKIHCTLKIEPDCLNKELKLKIIDKVLNDEKKTFKYIRFDKEYNELDRHEIINLEIAYQLKRIADSMIIFGEYENE